MSEKEVRYFSVALLRMWMENLVTDGEYNKIVERLNKITRESDWFKEKDV